MGVMVDGEEGAGLTPAKTGSPLSLGRGLPGVMECPACRGAVDLTTVSGPDCPRCGTGLGVETAPWDMVEEEAVQAPEGWPEPEAAPLVDDDLGDWSAPTGGWDTTTPDGFGIGDDGDEFHGASVEELIREEEEMDELFDV